MASEQHDVLRALAASPVVAAADKEVTRALQRVRAGAAIALAAGAQHGSQTETADALLLWHSLGELPASTVQWTRRVAEETFEALDVIFHRGSHRNGEYLARDNQVHKGDDQNYDDDDDDEENDDDDDDDEDGFDVVEEDALAVVDAVVAAVKYGADRVQTVQRTLHRRRDPTTQEPLAQAQAEAQAPASCSTSTSISIRKSSSLSTDWSAPMRHFWRVVSRALRRHISRLVRRIEARGGWKTKSNKSSWITRVARVMQRVEDLAVTYVADDDEEPRPSDKPEKGPHDRTTTSNTTSNTTTTSSRTALPLFSRVPPALVESEHTQLLGAWVPLLASHITRTQLRFTEETTNIVRAVRSAVSGAVALASLFSEVNQYRGVLREELRRAAASRVLTQAVLGAAAGSVRTLTDALLEACVENTDADGGCALAAALDLHARGQAAAAWWGVAAGEGSGDDLLLGLEASGSAAGSASGNPVYPGLAVYVVLAEMLRALPLVFGEVGGTGGGPGVGGSGFGGWRGGPDDQRRAKKGRPWRLVAAETLRDAAARVSPTTTNSSATATATSTTASQKSGTRDTKINTKSKTNSRIKQNGGPGGQHASTDPLLSLLETKEELTAAVLREATEVLETAALAVTAPLLEGTLAGLEQDLASMHGSAGRGTTTTSRRALYAHRTATTTTSTTATNANRGGLTTANTTTSPSMFPFSALKPGSDVADDQYLPTYVRYAVRRLGRVRASWWGRLPADLVRGPSSRDLERTMTGTGNLARALLEHMARRAMVLILRHVSLCRTEDAADRAQLQRDLEDLVYVIAQEVGTVPVEALRAVRGLHALLACPGPAGLADTAESLISPKGERMTTTSALPRLLAALHVVARAGSVLKLPHEFFNLTTRQYSSWLDERDEGEALAGVEKALRRAQPPAESPEATLRMEVLAIVQQGVGRVRK